MVARVLTVKLLSGEYHRIPLVRSQHKFTLQFGVVKQHAITWANVDQDLCRHMESLGHSEIIYPELI